MILARFQGADCEQVPFGDPSAVRSSKVSGSASKNRASAAFVTTKIFPEGTSIRSIKSRFVVSDTAATAADSFTCLGTTAER